MNLAIEIGLGIWFGAGLIAGSIWVIVTVVDRIKQNRRYGRPWYRWLEA